MSRPASCSAVYGLRPGTGSVVERWKYSGTISTRPPMATVMRISTIIRKLLVSMRSWPVALVSDMVGSSGVRQLRDRRRADRAVLDRHHHVPAHHPHARQVQQAAEQPDQVERERRLHALDE